MRRKCAAMRRGHLWRPADCLWTLPGPGGAKVPGMRPRVPANAPLAKVSHRGVPACEWVAGEEAGEATASPSGFGGNGVTHFLGSNDKFKKDDGICDGQRK